MKNIKNTLLLLPVAALALSGFLIALGSSASAAYKSSYLMRDSTFIDSSAMGVNAIQAFLNNLGSGLASYHDYEYCGSTSGSHYAYYDSFFRCDAPDGTRSSGKRLASQIIYDTSRAYGINPRVVMATLQKEQSLITDPSPTSVQLNTAMGYGCPNSCDPAYQGFFHQVDNGTWQLRFNYEGALKHTTWSDGWQPHAWYSGTCGVSHTQYSPGLYPGNNVYFKTDSGVAYTHFVIANAATASLYCYTPYVGPYSQTGYSGSYNFVTFYETYWGSVASVCYSDSNVAGADSGRKFLAYRYAKGADSLTYTRMNNTGSTCTEAHLWSYGYKSWAAHIATGMQTYSPSSGTLIAGNVAGDGRDEMIYMRYGNVQVHEFSQDLKKFLGIYDVPVNLSGVSAATGTFVTGDFLGRGYDQVLYLRYSNAQDHLEVHMFSRDLRKATGTYDVVNGLTGIDQNSGVFVAGDFLHKGYDQLVYVKYGTSKPVEVHVFSRDLRKARGTYDVATGLTNTASVNGTFVAGNFSGRGNQILYVKYGGGSQRVEVHAFSSDLRKVRGTYDVATNLGSISLPL